MADLQRPDRTALRTGAARGAAFALLKAGIDQFEYRLRADRNTGPAVTADRSVNSDHKQ
jgi:hypothetical protein